jgi:hypothetical protein
MAKLLVVHLWNLTSVMRGLRGSDDTIGRVRRLPVASGREWIEC